MEERENEGASEKGFVQPGTPARSPALGAGVNYLNGHLPLSRLFINKKLDYKLR